jgi:hypothetical protein
MGGYYIESYRHVAWSGFSWLRMGPRNRLVSTAVIEGKRPLGRPGHRWEDDIKMSLTDVRHGLNSAGSVWAQ